jgi:large subunit ribosomal protein L22
MSSQSKPTRAHVSRLSNIRVSPRKMRVVVDQIRYRNAYEALTLLSFAQRGAARIISKVLQTGLANVQAVHRDWNPEDLVVARAFVDEGPTLRRFRPRAQGRASRINKRTSHLTIELAPYPLEDSFGGGAETPSGQEN